MRTPILFFAVLWIGVTSQMPQDSEPAGTTTTIANDVKNETVNCTTARKINGVCTERKNCDYGPNNIDFTLYAPRGYKSICKSNEVCCPFEYILVQTEPDPSGESDDTEIKDEDISPDN